MFRRGKIFKEWWNDRYNERLRKRIDNIMIIWEKRLKVRGK